MILEIEFLREVDGRWIANIESLPGVMKCETTQEAALKSVKILALQVIADCVAHDEMAEPDSIHFIVKPQVVAA